MKRRIFLKSTVATGALFVATGAGLLKPGRVLAAEYPAAAFGASDPDSALQALLGTSDAADSAGIVIKAPLQAENGAVVPVKVTADGAEKMVLMVEGNPQPMVMALNVGAGAAGFISGRVKMGKTSNVTCYALVGGKLGKASQEIKVTVGGCGG